MHVDHAMRHNDHTKTDMGNAEVHIHDPKTHNRCTGEILTFQVHTDRDSMHVDHAMRHNDHTKTVVGNAEAHIQFNAVQLVLMQCVQQGVSWIPGLDY